MQSRAINFIKNIGFSISLIIFLIGLFTISNVFNLHANADESAYTQENKINVLDNQEQHNDSEAHKIDMWLASKGSPMEGVGSTCVAMAEQYQVPCDLVLGIAGAESGLGTKGYANGTNNAWGWGVHQGITFESWGWGVMKVGEGLRKYYFDQGLIDVWSIRPKYCPRGIDGNGYGNEWENRVLWYMNDLANFQV